MTKPMPTLFTALALMSAVLSLLTATDPQWLERLTGMSPDAGDGSTEWGLTLTFVIATIGFAILARRSWHGSLASR